MEKVFRTDISEKKEFTIYGDTLRMKECVDKEKHIYIFERYNGAGRLYAYEVVQGVKKKNPDGSIVYTYPSGEQFGTYGYFIAKNFINSARYGIADCVERLRNKKTRPQRNKNIPLR